METYRGNNSLWSGHHLLARGGTLQAVRNGSWFYWFFCLIMSYDHPKYNHSYPMLTTNTTIHILWSPQTQPFIFSDNPKSQNSLHSSHAKYTLSGPCPITSCICHFYLPHKSQVMFDDNCTQHEISKAKLFVILSSLEHNEIIQDSWNLRILFTFIILSLFYSH